MSWTEHRKRLVTELWREGRSYTEIGAELKVSRAAIAGIIKRLGIQRTKGRVPGNPFGSWRMSTKDSGLKPEPFVPAACDVEPLHLALLDLKSGQCRYPYGQGPYTFCGHPSEPDKPYCPAHCRIVYVAPKIRLSRKPRPFRTSGQEATANAAEWLEDAA